MKGSQAPLTRSSPRPCTLGMHPHTHTHTYPHRDSWMPKTRYQGLEDCPAPTLSFPREAHQFCSQESLVPQVHTANQLLPHQTQVLSWAAQETKKLWGHQHLLTALESLLLPDPQRPGFQVLPQPGSCLTTGSVASHCLYSHPALA